MARNNDNSANTIGNIGDCTTFEPIMQLEIRDRISKQ